MALDETFRPIPRFGEREVFDLTGKAETVRELRPSNFEGPIADWANRRMNLYGETIIPRQVYVERTLHGEHRVAWIYHDGIDLETEHSFSMHHIACDCNLIAEQMADPTDIEMFLGDCDALISALKQRAHFVSATYGMGNIIERMYDQERPAYDQSEDTQAFVESSLLYLLEHDYRHPESWLANVESGWNLISLAAETLGLRREDTGWFAADLSEKGMTETDGTVIALSPRARSEIDAEKLLRGLAA